MPLLPMPVTTMRPAQQNSNFHRRLKRFRHGASQPDRRARATPPPQSALRFRQWTDIRRRDGNKAPSGRPSRRGITPGVRGGGVSCPHSGAFAHKTSGERAHVTSGRDPRCYRIPPPVSGLVGNELFIRVMQREDSMSLREWSKSELAYGHKVLDCGIEGAGSPRKSFCEELILGHFCWEWVRHAFGSAALGACLGILGELSRNSAQPHRQDAELRVIWVAQSVLVRAWHGRAAVWPRASPSEPCATWAERAMSTGSTAPH